MSLTARVGKFSYQLNTCRRCEFRFATVVGSAVDPECKACRLSERAHQLYLRATKTVKESRDAGTSRDRLVARVRKAGGT